MDGFLNIDQAVRDWAWREYDRTATKRQRQLREKDKKKPQTCLAVSLDWAEVKFKDDTIWSRLAEDDLNEDENENKDKESPTKPRGDAVAPRTGAGAGGTEAGAPVVSVLFQTKFTNNTEDTQEYTMRTEKVTTSSCSTNVESGYTHGVELSVTMKTPCEVFEANAGYHREVSLTNSTGETFEETLSWGVESVIKVKPLHVAEAALVVDEKKQAGSFAIDTKIRGMVYVTFTNIRDNNSLVKVTGHDISDIIEEGVKLERRKGRAMDFVDIKDGTVYVKTKGTCKFRYGIKQEVKVDQTPL